MDSEFPRDGEPEPQDSPVDDDAWSPSFSDFIINRSKQLDDLLAPHSKFDPVQEMFDRYRKGARESIRLPHESDDSASPHEIEWPIARSDDPPGRIEQLPYLIPAQPGDGSASNVVKPLTAEDLQLADSVNDAPSQPEIAGGSADQQPYFNPPQPDGGAMFPLGSANSATADSLDDLPAADDPQDVGSSDDTSDDEAPEDDVPDEKSLVEDGPGNAPTESSSEFGPRASGLLQSTSDGGPPLARPIVLVSLTSAATQRLIEESLTAAAQRDSKTLESIAKAKVHDAFWIRDAQRRAVTGDW